MKSRKKERALVIDARGNKWVWDCGWLLCTNDGERKNNFKPLTHAVFRKSIELLDPGIPKHREVLHGMDRPGRAWRRFLNKEIMTHDQFGSVYVLASDGCHAVVEIHDGTHKDVCVENLSEHVGVPLPTRRGTHKAKTEHLDKAKVNNLANKYMNLLMNKQNA